MRILRDRKHAPSFLQDAAGPLALFLYFWICCFLVAGTIVPNRKRVDPRRMVFSAVFCVIAWTANRGVPHFIFAPAPLLAGNFDALLFTDSRSEKTPILEAPGAPGLDQCLHCSQSILLEEV